MGKPGIIPLGDYRKEREKWSKEDFIELLNKRYPEGTQRKIERLQECLNHRMMRLRMFRRYGNRKAENVEYRRYLQVEYTLRKTLLESSPINLTLQQDDPLC